MNEAFAPGNRPDRVAAGAIRRATGAWTRFQDGQDLVLVRPQPFLQLRWNPGRGPDGEILPLRCHLYTDRFQLFKELASHKSSTSSPGEKLGVSAEMPEPSEPRL